MKWLPVLLAASGAGAVAFLAFGKKASASERPHYAPSSGSTGRLTLKTTSYWPFTATEAERRMEGGIHGAAIWRGTKAIDPTTGKRPVLYTLEDGLAGKVPYVSLSGDPAVWPFGQRLEIDAWPGVVFRVVDTGANFKGKDKKYRQDGAEPIDICVYLKTTKIPTTSGARIVSGDNFEGGSPVAVANLRGQNVVVGDTECGPLTNCVVNADDCEALARAVESSCPKGDVYEKQAVAWACRNRAKVLGVSVHALLAPQGVYGPRGDGGRDFVSTAREPGDVSAKVAKCVLSLGADSDPTNFAIDFWNPSQQRRAKYLSDAHTMLGVNMPALPSEDEVRAALEAAGLRTGTVVGEIELLVSA